VARINVMAMFSSRKAAASCRLTGVQRVSAAPLRPLISGRLRLHGASFLVLDTGHYGHSRTESSPCDGSFLMGCDGERVTTRAVLFIDIGVLHHIGLLSVSRELLPRHRHK
jgi:hypothetical protein